MYHTLDDPLNPKQLPGKYSDLHTLYPGRPMDSSDDPNRYSIEPEDPVLARKSFQDVKDKTAIYGDQLERKTRQQGGGEKMTVHSVEDPSMIIEDPDLTPVLMTDDRVTDDGTARKPLIENYKSMKSNTNNEKPGQYKWILLVLMAVALFFLAYFYSTHTASVDIFEF
jgi:hypothetical protein